jgi:hypothetical protein
VGRLLEGVTPGTLDGPTLERLLAALPSPATTPRERDAAAALFGSFNDYTRVHPSRSLGEFYLASMSRIASGALPLDALCQRTALAVAADSLPLASSLICLAAALSFWDHYDYDWKSNIVEQAALARRHLMPSNAAEAAASLRAAATPDALALAVSAARQFALLSPEAAPPSDCYAIEEAALKTLEQDGWDSELQYMSANLLCITATMARDAGGRPGFAPGGRLESLLLSLLGSRRDRFAPSASLQLISAYEMFAGRDSFPGSGQLRTAALLGTLSQPPMRTYVLLGEELDNLLVPFVNTSAELMAPLAQLLEAEPPAARMLHALCANVWLQGFDDDLFTAALGTEPDRAMEEPRVLFTTLLNILGVYTSPLPPRSLRRAVLFHMAGLLVMDCARGLAPPDLAKKIYSDCEVLLLR